MSVSGYGVYMGGRFQGNTLCICLCLGVLSVFGGSGGLRRSWLLLLRVFDGDPGQPLLAAKLGQAVKGDLLDLADKRQAVE